jgi:uncharacterized protein YycO
MKKFLPVVLLLFVVGCGENDAVPIRTQNSLNLSKILFGESSTTIKTYEPVLTVYTYQIDGLMVRTGDLICTNTTEGEPAFNRLVSQLIGTINPGEVDHIAVYVGPGGRCVEARDKYGVFTFDIEGNTWYSSKMVEQRGVRDNLYGIAYPLAGLKLSQEEEDGIRKRAAMYCIRQAESHKPFNFVLLDSATENAFYCSQLAYKAYLKEGIDLNTGKGLPPLSPGMENIIFPQEIWSGCKHERASAQASR